ncbi:exopolysaccharide biosynthesis polyprenyl glycosylphosphotransferase [Nocardioides sp. J9]|uniref:sugar transferase n=1 Tax=Nocardioides sp. J9 TaxID=935844 RepID=UPI0011A1C5BD|nr:sugar transferase [Nocardioides sp. J9]TWG99173.1 exopolysaccharide biosynthesis polyprenyl glycosylphosphotransferase [Nocardioides sp. J9]
MTILEARALAVPATAGRARMEPVVHRASRVLLAGDALAATVVAALAISGPTALDPDLAGAFVLAWLVAVALTGDYRLPGTLGLRARRLGLVALALPTLVLLATNVLHRPLLPGTATVLCLSTAALGIAGRGVLAAASRRGFVVLGLVHRVVVVGSSESATTLLRRFDQVRAGRFEVVGACVADDGTCEVAPGPVTHGLQTCTGLARACDADAVLLAPDPAIDPAELLRLQWALDDSGLDTFVWAGVPAPAGGRTSLDLDGLPLLHVGRPRRLGLSYAVKRLLDRLLALVALLLAAPVIAVLAVAVRIDSEGPAFYRHTRVGKDDTRFTMWKLRTMTVNAAAVRAQLHEANQAEGPLFKIREDPRVTRLGKWLRRTSLDELPQLLNVVRGQMSLVGPRPALPSEVDQYHPDVRHRMIVHPGITGLWQVSGRSDLSWEESVRLDQRYVDDWSLMLDLKILLRTVVAVCRRAGAY